MAKLTLEYKRLSPNESIASLKDTTNNTKCWRHRFAIKYRSQLAQNYKDYSLDEFDSFEQFFNFIEEQPKQKYQIL
jgi:hypothetical protein